MPKDNNAVHTVGSDLGKRSFHVCAVDSHGKDVFSQKLTRTQLMTRMANLPTCLVAMEACGSAHYWARVFQRQAHSVTLIAPQFVKPFVKSNKNDQADAEAICEAVHRPRMRFVAPKSVEQQDLQSLHRIRSQVVSQRTAQVNQIRGLLHEYGIVLPAGRSHVRAKLPDILEDADNELSMRFRQLLSDLYDELVHLDERITTLDDEIEVIAKQSDAARRLMTIPGLGAKGATALLAAVGDIHTFKNGRECAAWTGLVPRQCATGGQPRLLGMSKRGDASLRFLLVHGARAVLQCVDRRHDPRSCWVQQLKQRRPHNVATVALANKMARMAFAVLKHEQVYSSDIAAQM